jgi:hypothetical protein
MLMHYFSCLGAAGAACIKTHRDTLRRTYVFASGGISGSRSAFWCIRGMKYQRTIFHPQVGSTWFQYKVRRVIVCAVIDD